MLWISLLNLVLFSVLGDFFFLFEINQEEKKENNLSTKKKIFFLFSWSVSWSRACFLSFFLDRYRFFFLSWSLSWSKTCFLVFLVSCFLFINSHLRNMICGKALCEYHIIDIKVLLQKKES